MWNRPEDQIDFYLIRHGATHANEEYRYLGKTDELLSYKGIAQMQTLGESRSCPQVEGVLVSPLGRCRQSAAIVFPSLPICEIEEWREMDFGDFEYKNYAELNGNPDYQAWIDSGGSIAFPDGESREEFVRRVVSGMNSAVEYIREKELKAVAAVVHGGTIMALLSHFCGGDYFSYQVKNGDGYRCVMVLGNGEIKMEMIEAL